MTLRSETLTPSSSLFYILMWNFDSGQNQEEGPGEEEDSHQEFPLIPGISEANKWT